MSKNYLRVSIIAIILLNHTIFDSDYLDVFNIGADLCFYVIQLKAFQYSFKAFKTPKRFLNAQTPMRTTRFT